MRTQLTFGILGLSLLSALPACKKNNNDGHSNSNPTGKPDTVYVLGTTNQANVYWVNGVENQLSSPTGVIQAPSLAVSGTTVYVGGSVVKGGTLQGNAEIWVNGVGSALPDSGAGSGSTIFVSGNDVYLAGISSYTTPSTVPYTTPNAAYPLYWNVATYWKNGVAASLLNVPIVGYMVGYGVDSHDDYVSSMFVSGNDVYVAGGSRQYQQGNPVSYQFAGYWKNGQFVNLSAGLIDTTQGNSSQFMMAYPNTTAIYVSGNDVYLTGVVYGQSSNQAVYWKDGAASYLQGAGGRLTAANGIFVSGSDVYVAGAATDNEGNQSAIYWKNGVPSTLSTAAGNSGANAICVLDTNVYVAGYSDSVGVSYATYWKNGVPVRLGAYGAASAIYVK